MQLWKSIALMCTLALASSAVVLADGSEAGSSGGHKTGSGSGSGPGDNSTNSSTPGDVTKAPDGGVPAPANAATSHVTWQTTVATFAATAVAVALV